MTDEPLARRIVTARRADGTSYFLEDAIAPEKSVPARPGYRVANLWVATGAPVATDQEDASRAHTGILPPTNGQVLRVIDFPPEAADPEERRKQMLATFRNLYPDAQHLPDTGHPGMHATTTVDYAIILKGEIFAVMDEGEKLMKAGDVLIQRGTSHAWANRSGAPCRIAFILIDAK